MNESIVGEYVPIISAILKFTELGVSMAFNVWKFPWASVNEKDRESKLTSCFLASSLKIS
jgi:hypothetical protein